MDIIPRIREIRKYRGLTQGDVASWLNISKQSWGKKESGKQGGFGPLEIKTFLDNTQIDARYLFGQLESIEAADLRIQKPKDKNLTDELIEEIQIFRQLNNPDKDEDPLLERIRNDALIRTIVSRLLKNRSMVPRIDSYMDALEEKDDMQAPKESSSSA